MRLVIVSNRLPTIVTWDNGVLKFKGGAGGLTSGLSAWLERQKTGAQGIASVWLGWPGATVPAEQQDTVRTQLADQYGAVPVFLSEDAMDKFYLGFCNKTIWPLFHYFTSYVDCNPESWEKYREVNQTFCDELAAMLQPGDVVWVHDYHLMLLPGLLRQRCPEVSIGFFLHIPFPSFEIFRLLPGRWRAEILEGLLGADLIGFHTHDYVQHFLTAVRRILGYDAHLGSIPLPDRVVRADTFPMGIDYHLFASLASSAAVQAEADRLQATLQGMRTILSIDRLDYSKGIPSRLRGYARFLELNPAWHGQVCMAMVVVPSRIGVDQYDLMKRQIDELVGDINGRFGSVGWTPIRYQYRMLSSVPMTALYTVSDVALVTPLRDGMNLIAKEYLACRAHQTGVLVLSEMAGAAHELGQALIVNPNNADEIAEALLLGLEMTIAEQTVRTRVMQETIRRHDVNWWAEDFLRVLAEVKAEQGRRARVWLTPDLRGHLLDAYRMAHSRLLLLDYDGTLVPFQNRPDDAVPGPELMDLLRSLIRTPATRVAIVSGRSRRSMETWFSGLELDLAAEHGAWQRDARGEWTTPVALPTEWKDELRPFLQSCVDRMPGSFIEEKDFALVWHYRNCDPDLGAHRAKELTDILTSLVANMDVQVLPGHKVVEVRNASLHKGTVASRLMASAAFDFILAAGDDWTDEDLFRAVPADAWSIKVGPTTSGARFNVPGPGDVLTLLHDLVGLENPVPCYDLK